MNNWTKGLDVSHYDGTINWDQVKAAGNEFAFFKATEGVTYADPSFSRNWAAAKAAGLLRGAYHFFHASKDAMAQADAFLKVIGTCGELPCVLDLEMDDGAEPPIVAAGAKKWLAEVELATGKRPIIYTGRGFAMLQDFDPWFTAFPLWCAQYGPPTPQLVPPWKDWAFWQYSQNGKVSGIGMACDLNYFNGTAEQLHSFALGHS